MTESEREHQKNLERIRRLRLIDDVFMNVCFDDNIEGTELILRIILNKPDIIVKSVKTQRVMKNLLGRDIWLDISATDSEGKEYNVEIQRTDRGADVKRARYHSSIMDAHLLRPTEDFSSLPETYVIFITENDVLGDGEPIYTVDRIITNTGKRFNDGEHIVYVNGAGKNALTALGRLMHDFFCTDPNDMFYSELAEKVRYFKENEKGAANMNSVLDEMRMEAEQKAVDRRNVEMAKDMISQGGFSLELIAKLSRLTIERVQELAAQKALQ